jgi:hypothetical protein
MYDNEQYKISTPYTLIQHYTGILREDKGRKMELKGILESKK